MQSSTLLLMLSKGTTTSLIKPGSQLQNTQNRHAW